MTDELDPQVAAREELARRQEEEDVKWLMGNQVGRRFVWGLLEFAGVHRTSMTADNWTFFNEGQRNVGLKIVDQIHRYCPEMYEHMVKENK